MKKKKNTFPSSIGNLWTVIYQCHEKNPYKVMIDKIFDPWIFSWPSSFSFLEQIWYQTTQKNSKLNCCFHNITTFISSVERMDIICKLSTYSNWIEYNSINVISKGEIIYGLNIVMVQSVPQLQFSGWSRGPDNVV